MWVPKAKCKNNCCNYFKDKLKFPRLNITLCGFLKQNAKIIAAIISKIN